MSEAPKDKMERFFWIPPDEPVDILDLFKKVVNSCREHTEQQEQKPEVIKPIPIEHKDEFSYEYLEKYKKKARKSYTCDVCKKTINRGDYYYNRSLRPWCNYHICSHYCFNHGNLSWLY